MSYTLRILINLGRSERIFRTDEAATTGTLASALDLGSELANRGHDVHLFSSNAETGPFRGMHVHPRNHLADFAEEPVDVFILTPDLLPLLMPIRARARVVWTGSGYVGGDSLVRFRAQDSEGVVRWFHLFPVDAVASLVDRMVVGSEWQRGRMHPFPSDRIRVRNLGVRLEWFRSLDPHRASNRLVYASSARYGLDLLLGFVPEITRRFPDAVLHAFASVSGESVDRVVLRGRIPRPQLAVELLQSGLMAYPNMVSETFSVAVAEAQAAGLPVVTSARAALAERVRHGVDGILIEGDPRSAEYGERFINAAVGLLEDPGAARRLGKEGRDRAFDEYSWERIAEEWESDLIELIDGRRASLPAPDSFRVDKPIFAQTRGTTIELSVRRATTEVAAAWSAYGFDPRSMLALTFRNPHES